MDVNEFMKRSIELQEKQLELLTTIAEGLASQVSIDVRVPVETAKAVEAAAETVKPDASKGSSKQASNHAKDDAKQAAAADEGKKEKPKTAEDVRSALMKLGKVQGSEAAITLLKSHGATSVSGLDPEKYVEVIAAVEEACKP